MLVLRDYATAVGVIDVRSYEIAECAPHDHVGREMIASEDASGGDGSAQSIPENLAPDRWVLVREDRTH